MKKTVLLILLMLLSCGLIFAAGTQEQSGTQAADSGPAEFNYYYYRNAQPMEEEVFAAINEKLIEKYNIKGDFHRLDSGSMYRERMAVLLAAQEPIDLFFIANWCLDFKQKLAQGALLPLDDLIAEHAPKLVPSLPDFLMDVSLHKNDHYAVPNYQTVVDWRAYLVPKKLVDKYGLDVEGLSGLPLIEMLPKFEPFLKKIKENEPELFGIAPEFVWNNKFEDVGGARVVVDAAPTVKIEDGELDEYKKQLTAIFRDYYRKGYLRKDEATASSDEKRRDQESLRYALWGSSYKPGAEVEWKIQYKDDIVGIPIGEPYAQSTAGMNTMYAISIFSTAPEAAIKFVEVMNTDKELYNMMCHGIEGTTFKKVGPNRIELIKGSDENYLYYPKGDWMFGNQFNAYLKPGQADDLWEKTDQMNRAATASPVRGFSADLTPIKDIKSRVDAVNSEYKGTEFLYIDNEDKYLALQEERTAKMKQAGVLEIHEEIQRQLIEYAKENDKPFVERNINLDPDD